MERRDFIKSALVAFTFPNIIIPKYEETGLRKVFILHKTIWSHNWIKYTYSWIISDYKDTKQNDIVLFINDNKTSLMSLKGNRFKFDIIPSVITKDAYILDSKKYGKIWTIEAYEMNMCLSRLIGYSIKLSEFENFLLHYKEKYDAGITMRSNVDILINNSRCFENTLLISKDRTKCFYKAMYSIKGD